MFSRWRLRVSASTSGWILKSLTCNFSTLATTRKRPGQIRPLQEAILSATEEIYRQVFVTRVNDGDKRWPYHGPRYILFVSLTHPLWSFSVTPNMIARLSWVIYPSQSLIGMRPNSRASCASQSSLVSRSDSGSFVNEYHFRLATFLGRFLEDYPLSPWSTYHTRSQPSSSFGHTFELWLCHIFPDLQHPHHNTPLPQPFGTHIRDDQVELIGIGAQFGRSWSCTAIHSWVSLPKPTYTPTWSAHRRLSTTLPRRDSKIPFRKSFTELQFDGDIVQIIIFRCRRSTTKPLVDAPAYNIGNFCILRQGI